MHKDNAFLRIAKVDVNEAMNIDSRESFKDILKTEQNFQLEAEQREMEKTDESFTKYGNSSLILSKNKAYNL